MYNFLKKLRTLFLKKSMVLIILVIFIFGIIVNTTQDYEQSKYLNIRANASFNDEWEIVANRILIRLNSIFYMANDSLLIFSVFTEKRFLEDISFIIKLGSLKVSSSRHQINFNRIYEFDRYVLYQIRANVKIDLNEEIKLYVIYQNYSSNALDVLIRKKNDNTNSIYLCSKFYNNFLKFEHFNSWIQINIKLNYSKIIVYNNSLLNDEKFHGLFNLNRNIVQLKNYHYMPYFNPNTNAIEFHNYSDGKYKGVFFEGVLYTHERIAINECYLDNAYNTEFIAVMDSDEVVLPNYDNRESNCKTLDLYKEMKHIRNSIGPSLSSISYWFSYKLFIKPEFDRVLISALNSSIFNQTTFIRELNVKTDKYPGTEKQIEILILNEDHFKYAKDLLNFYEKNLMKRKETLNPFEFLFSFQKEYPRQYGWGKSVHDTKGFITFGHHDSINARHKIEIDYKYGYVGHFRQTANRLPVKMNVTSLRIDLNFYNCFWNKDILF